MYRTVSDLRVLTTVLAMLGKMGALAGFTTMYLYSAELYPTIVRNAGMGASSCMARVGSMVAPYIANLVCKYCRQFIVLVQIA